VQSRRAVAHVNGIGERNRRFAIRILKELALPPFRSSDAG